MRKTLIINIIAILVIFTGCKKEKNIITGQLTDMSSGEIISNAFVELYYTEVSSSGNFNPTFKLLSSTRTNDSGNYRFEFDSKLYVKLRVSFSKEGYHKSHSEFDPESVLGSYTKDKKLALESYLKINIENRISNEDSDRFTVKLIGVNPECDVCCGDDIKIYSGSSVRESVICPVVGGDTITLEASKRTSSGYSEEQIKILCPIGDTVVKNYIY